MNKQRIAGYIAFVGFFTIWSCAPSTRLAGNNNYDDLYGESYTAIPVAKSSVVQNLNPEYAGEAYTDGDGEADYYDDTYLSTRNLTRKVSEKVGYSAGFTDGYNAGSMAFSNPYFFNSFSPYIGLGFGSSLYFGRGFGWGGYNPYRFNSMYGWGYPYSGGGFNSWSMYDYYAFGSPFNSYYGMGNGWYGNPYMYSPGIIVINNNGDRQLAARSYGPRSQSSVNSGSAAPRGTTARNGSPNTPGTPNNSNSGIRRGVTSDVYNTNAGSRFANTGESSSGIYSRPRGGAFTSNTPENNAPNLGSGFSRNRGGESANTGTFSRPRSTAFSGSTPSNNSVSSPTYRSSENNNARGSSYSNPNSYNSGNNSYSSPRSSSSNNNSAPSYSAPRSAPASTPSYSAPARSSSGGGSPAPASRGPR